MSAPALPRPTVTTLRADLAKAEEAHTAAVGVAVSKSNRDGEHDAWAHVRTAAGVVHQARAALKQAEDQAPPVTEGPGEGADAVTGFPRAAYRKRRMA